MNGYEAIAPIPDGTGGSRVARARRLADGAEVVLKRLPGGAGADWLQGAAERAREVAAIGHPALPRIFEVVGDGADLVIVMEHAPGGSLADRLASGAQPPGVVAELFATLAEGLEAAHRAGILHLDLKPTNVLFRANGDAFLSDFGHDRLMVTSGQPTLGTARYLDPAVARGWPPDAGADTYALAALAYEALSGAPPFPGDSVVEVTDAARLGAVPPLAEVAPAVPAVLASAVDRALAPERPARHGGAEAFAAALLPGGPPGLPAAASATPEPPAPGVATAGVPEPPVPTGEVGPARPRPAGAAFGRPVGLAAMAAAFLLIAAVAVVPLFRTRGARHVLTSTGALPSTPGPSPILTPTPTAVAVLQAPALAIVTATASPTPPTPRPSPRPDPVPVRRPAVVAVPPPAPKPPPPQPVIIPSAPAPSPTPAGSPAIPPRGQRIAFTGTRDGKRAIYVTDPAGSVDIRLTTEAAGEDFQPAWSPDGSRIAFTSTRDGAEQIYLMNADGTGQHRLTQGTANNDQPAWDPKGVTIAYVSDQNGPSGVFETGATGGAQEYAGPTPASTYTGAFAAPQWSPDGSRLTASYGSGNNVEIASWPISGGPIYVLGTAASSTCSDPSYPASGTTLLASCSQGGGPRGIWTVGPGPTGQALTSGPSSDGQPHYSPGADHIVFVRNNAGRQLWVMQAGGGAPGQIPHLGGEAYDPSWG